MEFDEIQRPCEHVSLRDVYRQSSAKRQVGRVPEDGGGVSCGEGGGSLPQGVAPQ